jgi:hypothetical protein
MRAVAHLGEEAGKGALLVGRNGEGHKTSCVVHQLTKVLSLCVVSLNSCTNRNTTTRSPPKQEKWGLNSPSATSAPKQTQIYPQHLAEPILSVAQKPSFFESVHPPSWMMLRICSCGSELQDLRIGVLDERSAEQPLACLSKNRKQADRGKIVGRKTLSLRSADHLQAQDNCTRGKIALKGSTVC